MACSEHNARLLSECLDGRLPSKRREALLRHVFECSACRSTYEGFERSRDLVLGLPVERVGDRFREGLWERIRTGEGTPEPALRSPIPWPSKVRYVLTGAAAAAVVLAAVQFASSTLFGATDGPADQMVAHAPLDPAPAASGMSIDGSGEQRSGDGPARGGMLHERRPGSPLFADVERIPVESARSLGSSQQLGALAAQSVEPLSLARSVNDELRSHTRRLVWRARDLREARNGVDLTELDDLRRRTRDAAASASALRWMSEQGFVDLTDLHERVVAELIGMGRRASDADESELRGLLQDAARLDAQALDQSFNLRCCPDPESFRFQLFEHVSENPDIARVLRLHVLPSMPSILPDVRVPGSHDPTSIYVIRLRDDGERSR
jgi:hypothetical protein